MKKIYLYLIIFFCIGMSCTDSLEDIMEERSYDVEVASTRLESSFTIPKGKWEDWTKIKIVDLADSISVPWNKSFVATSIPNEVRFDIRAEDGWILLENSIARQEAKMNYLIFYNQFTGVLKGFYYLEEASAGNNAYWQIEFPDRKKVFYCQDGFFTYPVSQELNISSIDVMNVTTNKTKGLTIGWNCFQFELSYQYSANPNFSLGISVYQQNIGTISLEGDFDASSSGSIVSNTPSVSSSKPSMGLFNKGNITMLQDSAKQWLLSNISVDGSKKPIKNVAANVIKNLVNNDMSSMVTSGLGLIFGSWGGSKSATPTSFSLNFKTTGSIKIEGTTGQITTTSIPSIRLTKGFYPGLGFWNLANAPVLSINRYAKVQSARWNPAYQLYPQLEFLIKKEVDPNRSLIQINPIYRACIRHLSVEYSLSTGHLKGENLNYYSDTRTPVRTMFESGLGYHLIAKQYKSSRLPEVVYWDEDTKTRIEATSWDVHPRVEYVTGPVFGIIPSYRSQSDGAPYHDITTQKTSILTEDVKVKVHYVISVNGKYKSFYSVRTYDPTIEYIVEKELSINPHVWSKDEMSSYFKDTVWN